MSETQTYTTRTGRTVEIPAYAISAGMVDSWCEYQELCDRVDDAFASVRGPQEPEAEYADGDEVKINGHGFRLHHRARGGFSRGGRSTWRIEQIGGPADLEPDWSTYRTAEDAIAETTRRLDGTAPRCHCGRIATARTATRAVCDNHF